MGLYPRAVALFVAIGAFTLASQTLLFREYLVSCGGNELSIAVFFAAWLFWIAVGATVASKSSGRIETARLFLPLVTLYPAFVVVQALMTLELRSIAGVDAVELFPLSRLLAVTWLVNCPVSFLTGFLFQAGCLFSAGASRSEARDQGQLAARLYAFEALGGFVGGLVVTGLLWRMWHPFVVLGVASISLLLAALSVSRALRAWFSTIGAAGFLAVAVVALVTPLEGSIEGWLSMERWESTMPSADLVEITESPFQQISVGELPGQTVFLANGVVVASTADDVDHAVTAALLFAQHPDSQRVLVVGLGSEGLVPHLLRYDVVEVVVVSIDASFHEIVLEQHASAARAFADPRVTISFRDVRELLRDRNAQSQPSFDLVLVNVPDPETAFLNRFYTVDFYLAVRSALAQDGVLATHISAGENYAGTELVQYGRSVYSSLHAVFAHVVVTPGEKAWFFASPTEHRLSLDSSVLTERLSGLERRDESFPPDAFSSIVPQERLAATLARFESTGGLSPRDLINSDSRPISLFLNLLVVGERAGVGWGTFARALRALGLWVFLVPLAILLAFRLTFRATTKVPDRACRHNGIALLGVFGAVSMCLYILLLVSFQNRFGHLFLSVGLLSALFMLGLFGGGVGGSALFLRTERLRFWPAHLTCAVAIVLCVGLPGLTSGIGSMSSQLALSLYYLLFLCTGTICGLAFPAAGYFVERAETNPGKVAGVLESADHWGGALGALAVGVFAIPVLGVVGTASLLAAIVLAAWFLFAVEQLGGWRGVNRLPGVQRLKRWLERVRRHRQDDIRRGLVFAVLAVVTLVGVFSNLLFAEMSAPRVHLDEEWLESKLGALSVEVIEEPFVHYVSHDDTTRDFQEIAVMSRAIAPEIEGYGGPINLMVIVAADGELTEVSLVESHETPNYITGVEVWLGQFAGWPLDRAIVIDGPSAAAQSVDVMSGATVTSAAMAEILERSRVAVSEGILGIPAEIAPPPSLLNRLGWREAYVVLALLLVVPAFLRLGSNARDLFLLSSVVLGGVVFELQFSLAHVARLLSTGLPTSHAIDWWLLTAGVVVLGIGLGQIYCGYLCPFGALQELLGRLGLTRPVTEHVARPARKVKFGILAVVLLVFFVTRSDWVFAIDPLQALFAYHYGAAMLTLLVVIGVLSLFYFRFWCRYLCPVGAFFALFNRLGVALRWARLKVYAACELGVRTRRDMDCIQCNRCIWEHEAQRGDAERRSREKPVGGVRAAGLIAGVAGCLLILLVLSGAGGSDRFDVEGSLGEPRDVDVELIRQRIQEGQLSDHEALFYEALEGIEDVVNRVESSVPIR